jgi:hypothetical protein
MSHYKDEYEKLLKIYTEEFQEHQLVKVVKYIYQMRRPGTNIYSVWIAFFGGRIAITGDAIIEDRGVISDLGYGLEWFVGELAPDYLGEKFLRRRWVKEKAWDWVKDELEEIRRNLDEEKSNNLERVEALQDIHNTRAFDEFEFWQIWGGIGNDCEDCPSWGYDPAALAMLVTVQKRFAELHRKVHEK